MSMSGSRLTGTLYNDYLAQLQAAFPIPGGLLGPEQAGLNSGQMAIAQALANAGGPDIVTEVQQATVAVTVASVTGVTSGASVSGPGTGSGTVS